MAGLGVRWSADTERAFLLALKTTGGVRKAAAAIGRSVGGAYKRRERRPEFAAAWDGVVRAMEEERLADGLAAVMPDGVALPPALTRTRTDGWTQQRQRRFLRALGDHGRYAEAAAAAGLSATSVRNFRRRSPQFQALCDKALVAGGTTVEEAAYVRAVEGWEEPVLHNGQVVGYRRRFSDVLAKTLLERDRPAPAAKRRGQEYASDEEVTRLLIERLGKLAAAKKKQARAAQLAWAERLERDGLAP